MTDFSKIPDEEHYALIVNDSHTYYTPGDERSRTNPGHGYPEGYETIKAIGYEAYSINDVNAMERLKERILRLDREYKSYKVVKVKPMKVSTKVEISFA